VASCPGLFGSPTVLVADDEELMLEVMSIMIEENGGKVLSASDGRAAVELFKQKQEEVDLVVLDFSMPKLNGYEACVAIKQLKPAAGVVLVSGLKMTPEVEDLVNKGQVAFLSKPFREAELLAKLNGLLGKGPACR
jgi:two-component system, cell cycle sensor histidine kinase and response regulator CckA